MFPPTCLPNFENLDTNFKSLGAKTWIVCGNKSKSWGKSLKISGRKLEILGQTRKPWEKNEKSWDNISKCSKYLKMLQAKTWKSWLRSSESRVDDQQQAALLLKLLLGDLETLAAHDSMNQMAWPKWKLIGIKLHISMTVSIDFAFHYL